MKTQIQLLSLTILLCLTSFGLFAQNEKVGYVDYNYVFTSLPDYKQAVKQVEDYGKELKEKLEYKQQENEEYYQKIISKVQTGSLSPVEQENAEQKIQQDQTDLQNLAQEYDIMLVEKEEALVAPIKKKIREAIKRVAKANNYSVIVNSAGGEDSSLVLYGRDDRDVTFLVLKELGINN